MKRNHPVLGLLSDHSRALKVFWDVRPASSLSGSEILLQLKSIQPSRMGSASFSGCIHTASFNTLDEAESSLWRILCLADAFPPLCRR